MQAPKLVEPPVSSEQTSPPVTQPVPEKKGGRTKKVSKIGSRRQVYNGTAMMTAGGLTKEKLMKTERGRIVSAAKHKTMKQRHTS